MIMLEESFIQKCREAFAAFDVDNSGTIDRFKMKMLLEAIGENPSEEDLFRFMAEIDEDGRRIEFSEFLRAFEKQKDIESEQENIQDTIDAWVALGGNTDKTGMLDAGVYTCMNGRRHTYILGTDVYLDKLSKLLIEDFGMSIDIRKLMRELNSNDNGTIDFNEFTQLLG